MWSLIKQCSATVLCPARFIAMPRLSALFFPYWILRISLLWKKNLLRVTSLWIFGTRSKSFAWPWRRVPLCTVRAVVSCAFAGVQLAEPPRVREEEKGWEAGRRQRCSSVAREGADCLQSVGWRHVVWLQPPSFPLRVQLRCQENPGSGGFGLASHLKNAVGIQALLCSGCSFWEVMDAQFPCWNRRTRS